MQMTKILIAIPVPLKRKLDALRGEGYTVAGFVRAVLERELKNVPVSPKQGG